VRVDLLDSEPTVRVCNEKALDEVLAAVRNGASCTSCTAPFITVLFCASKYTRVLDGLALQHHLGALNKEVAISSQRCCCEQPCRAGNTKPATKW
jgi:hypothetical protein